MPSLLWIPIVGLGLAGGLLTGAAAFHAPAQDGRERHLASYAQFAGDRLEQCMDLLSVAKPGQTGIAAEIEAGLANTKLEGNGTVRIGKACGEQLKDRPLLAKCTRQEDRSKLTLTITLSYYDASALVDSDAAMKDCLSRGGEWHAADRRFVATEALRKSMRDLEALGAL
jgi:hypothetical protein